MNKCPLLALSLTLLSIFPSVQASAADQPVPKIPMGMNLSSINDWTSGFPFKNLMWSARSWQTRNAEGGGPFSTELGKFLSLDENGYPLEIPFTPEGEPEQVVFTIFNNLTEPGLYVLLYDGEGEIGPAMSTKIVESEPGRVVMELKGGSFDAGYEGFTILKSTKGNHVRNIRILKLEDENADLAANPFRDDFLEYCRQWHVLRFMDWQATNNSLEDKWEDRKLPTFYTMVGSNGDAIGRSGKPASEYQRLFSGGVALEIIIQLANMTKTNPWFCVPHRATLDYMENMAKLIHEKLDPSLTAYIEYSNEVWNWQFEQAHWMLQSKIAAEPLASEKNNGWKDGIPPEEFPLDNGTVARDGGADHPERMAVLIRRCFEPFEKVFSGDSRKRLVRVIGVQQSWPDTVRRTTRWVMQNGGADAVSPAGYFGPDNDIYARWAEAGESLTVEDVINDMNQVLANKVPQLISEVAAIAREYNLRYIVYEGGQHIQPKNQQETPYMPALKATQFSEALYGCYMENFRLHADAGCDLFAAFSSFSQQGTRWGSWGHQEFIGQPRSEIPKYGALLDTNTPKP
ncbi:MAG: hypothetical protein Fur0032_05800 [Terrimicrobiaceae bacterium]